MHDDVLIYGFGSYGNFADNITSNIVKQIQRLKISNAVVFETQFSNKMFDDAFSKYQPKIVLGLGQHPRAKKIRIERRSVNWMVGESISGQMISKTGPKFRYANLKLAKNANATITYDAGDYVCNYSMYLMSEICAKNNAKYAFLHVPLAIEISTVIEFIKKGLRDRN